jgi:hypothetical protein
MYLNKTQAINKYLDNVNVDQYNNINKVDDVVWVNSDKISAILREQVLVSETSSMRLPPMIEADWDTNDTKEFDRLLYKILFKERTLH